MHKNAKIKTCFEIFNIFKMFILCIFVTVLGNNMVNICHNFHHFIQYCLKTCKFRYTKIITKFLK